MLYYTQSNLRKIKSDKHCVAGLCASAATFVHLLECTSFELSDGFHALIHNGSLGDLVVITNSVRVLHFI